MTPFRLNEFSSGQILTDRGVVTNLPLSQRVRSGVSWNVSSALISELISFLRSVILARLLVPDDFGLFGMTLTLLAALNAMTAIASDETIIASKFQTTDDLNAHLNTVWSAELIRSAFIAVATAMSSLPVSRFYGQPRLVPVISILGVTVLIQGLQNVGLVLLRKELTFGTLFRFELLTNIAGAAVTIALALVMHSVWALVLGLLLTAAIRTGLSFVFHPFRPRLNLDRIALRRVLKFGKYALLIGISSYVTTMADKVAVGRLLGPGALGNYALAYTLASVTIGVLVNTSGRVLSPAFAEIGADHHKRLARSFNAVFRVSTLMLIGIAVPVFLLAHDIVLVLFGDRWASAGTVLRILALLIPLRGLVLITTMVFFGLNHPRPVANAKLAEAIVFLVALFPLISMFGLVGAAWAGVISYAFACVNRLLALERIIPGILPALSRSSLLATGVAAAGLLMGGFAIRFFSSGATRISICGLLAILPALAAISLKTDLKRLLLTGAVETPG